MISKGNYVNGKWKNGGGASLVSYSPNDGAPIWEGLSSTKGDISACIEYANNALSQWSSLTLDDRIFYLRKYVELVKENSEKIARAISIEIGKPLWEANTEVSAIMGKLEPTIAAYNFRNTELVRDINVGISRTQFKPLGVVAVIGPYNFPGHMANGHIMPALLSGNTVVLKPSEKGAMTAELLMESWAGAGLPNGVINMVQGEGDVGETLVSHKDIHGVFFTGSYSVGERIRQICGTEKLCALEMGGNSSLIVWDSSNIDAAVLATIQSSYITAGQRCSSARRVIIANNSFGEAFVKKLVETARRIIVGRYDNEPEPFFGPLRNLDMVNAILEAQELLIKMGGQLLLKCEQLPIGSCFVSPGIIDITNVTNKPDHEIIAPFISLIRVDSFEAAIEEANNSEYGLAAGVITEDRNLYERFNTKIQAGIVNWNQPLTGAVGIAPFGGIKKSGNYRPSGYFAVDYCVYAVASIEVEQIKLPMSLPKGVKLC